MRQFLQIGHFPTLVGAFLHFDVSFMVWVLLGALGVFIAQDLQLSPAQKGLAAAVPILGGSLFRIPVGFLADRYGPKRVGSVTMLLTLVPLALGWLFATSLSQVLLIGILLGVAGASFAVSLPLASRWYPAEYQGIVMGIAGAGNSGTVLANLFAPRLAEQVGWHGVMALAMLPVLVVALVFIVFAKDSPTQPAPISLGRFVGVLGKADAWWFCLFYSITFGGFVGLSSFLPIFFFDQYGIARVDAGSLTALCVFGGSLFRPLGGLLADRFGGITVLSVLYLAIAGLMIGVAQLPAVSVVTPLLILGMFSLGMGNGAVFQLVPQRFGREIGAMTGIVGAAGGLGGFVLPSLLGLLKEQLGTYGAGFLVLAAAALLALSALRLLYQFEAGWRTVWQGRVTAQPGSRPILAE